MSPPCTSPSTCTYGRFTRIMLTPEVARPRTVRVGDEAVTSVT